LEKSLINTAGMCQFSIAHMIARTWAESPLLPSLRVTNQGAIFRFRPHMNSTDTYVR